MAWSMAGDGESPRHPYSMEVAYEWDTEGRMTSLTNPVLLEWNGTGSGTKLKYGYDAIGRLETMKEVAGAAESIVATATYGMAGEMLGLSYSGMSETRTYNSSSS
jgi:hypothetical protein